MSNTAEFLSGEGTDFEPKQEGEKEGTGLKELNHHLWPLFMPEEEIEECRRLYPGFRCVWNGHVVFVIQDLSVRRAICPNAIQARIMNRRLKGEDCLWIKGPRITSEQDFEPDTLVLDRQSQEIFLASDYEREKERKNNPFPVERAMFLESARWVVLVFDKYDQDSVIKRMVKQAEEAFEPRLCKPHVLIDTYLWQSKKPQLLVFRTRSVKLEPLRSEDARALQEAEDTEIASLPNSALRWWRRLQDQVPRHGRMISVFTPVTASAFLNMAYWQRKRDWKKVPRLLKPGNMLVMRWTLDGIRFTYRNLFDTDR